MQDQAKRKNSSLPVNLFIFLMTFFITILFFEFIFYIINQRRDKITTNAKDYIISDARLGYKPKSNFSHHAVSHKNDVRVYDVTYTMDQYGRRITPKKDSASPHLIFFGGSFTFGEGLNDNETLPWYLSSLVKHSVYNYGAPGYGPNMMLAQISQDDFGKDIHKDGIAIYVFINDHIRRVVGDISIDDRAPYYYLDKQGNLIRKGTFKTGKPIQRFFINVLRVSNILRYFRFPFFHNIHDSDIYLASVIVKKAAQKYNEKYNGTFYILLHPLSDAPEKFLKLIKKDGIKILDYRGLLDPHDREKYKIKDDGHPNALLNKMLAKRIKEDLKE